jgi:glycosyltransferase involved in cell wall biosynthesis
MARLVSVYRADRRRFRLEDASYIRWLKVAEALARQGHRVDLAALEPRGLLLRSAVEMGPRLRRVPLDGVDWNAYDVVKTCFHRGFETLERRGGAGHPFIIAKLGSVVAAQDREGIYFYGKQRERLWRLQCRIAERARWVTVLSEPARELWRSCFGRDDNVLLVPGGVDREIDESGADPFPRAAPRRCLFAGNLYGRSAQPEAHAVLIAKMNELGRRVAAFGARLYHVGTGDTDQLDPRWVHSFGAVTYQRSWAFLLHADLGVVLSAGAFMHNNESTKIYHYLRAGLPIVSEAGFPNDNVVHESGLGLVIESGRLDLFAAAVEDALARRWDRDAGRRYVLDHHTWDRRCEVYRDLLAEAPRLREQPPLPSAR